MMHKYAIGDTVRIIDGFAHIGGEAAVESISKDAKARPIYRLKGIPGWWPQASLESYDWFWTEDALTERNDASVLRDLEVSEVPELQTAKPPRKRRKAGDTS